MSYGLWLSAAGMQVNEYRQSLAANNLANVDTVGFKHDFAVLFERQLEQHASPQQATFAPAVFSGQTGGTWVRPTYTAFEQGSLEETGRSLDLALEGDGFFMVGHGSDVRYTRDGRFLLDDDGTLKLNTNDGTYSVLNAAGGPIVADPALGRVDPRQDGSLVQNGEVIDRIGIVDFEDRSLLRKEGGNLFSDLGGQRPQPAAPRVQSGYLERSTVHPVEGLTKMIEITRAFEMNARMVTLQDQTIGQTVSRVGRIG